MLFIYVVIPFLFEVIGSAFADHVQKPDLQLPPSARFFKNEVRDIFVESYDAYRKYAWGHDDLTPLSRGYADERNGWGATIIDAMDTMYLMGLQDWFHEAVAFTAHIDFSRSGTHSHVSVFETTIRYLGGLLSAYQLSGEQHPILLQKARELADKMAYAWVGSNKLPFGFIDFRTNNPIVASSNIAEAGSLILEWDTLSKYTGNNTYSALALEALTHIANLPSPLPGLAAQGVDPETGKSIAGYVTWGGGSDSYFEYLIKYTRLSNTDNPLFADTWYTAVDTSIKTLLKKSTTGNWTYLADYDSMKRIRHVGSHLACFHAGNWLLGGRLSNNHTIVKIALDLVDGCWNTYASTTSSIGPEAFAYISSDGNFTGNPITHRQLKFYNQHGFYVTSSAYILRPEVLESNFYAYRVTGDQKYFDRAVSAIDHFKKHLRTTSGYAGLLDVNDPRAKIDDTESFWFAEVLKYMYLTFDNPERISLDEYVFTTECHPFKAPPAKSSYAPTKLGGPTSTKPFILQTGGPPLPIVSSAFTQAISYPHGDQYPLGSHHESSQPVSNADDGW